MIQSSGCSSALLDNASQEEVVTSAAISKVGIIWIMLCENYRDLQTCKFVSSFWDQNHTPFDTKGQPFPVLSKAPTQPANFTFQGNHLESNGTFKKIYSICLFPKRNYFHNIHWFSIWIWEREQRISQLSHKINKSKNQEENIQTMICQVITEFYLIFQMHGTRPGWSGRAQSRSLWQLKASKPWNKKRFFFCVCCIASMQ